jgi:hypothetical protein
MRAGDDRTGTWRDSSFRLFLGADAISQFGTQITLVALPLVAVLTLDASSFQITNGPTPNHGVTARNSPRRESL